MRFKVRPPVFLFFALVSNTLLTSTAIASDDDEGFDDEYLAALLGDDDGDDDGDDGDQEGDLVQAPNEPVTLVGTLRGTQDACHVTLLAFESHLNREMIADEEHRNLFIPVHRQATVQISFAALPDSVFQVESRHSQLYDLYSTSLSGRLVIGQDSHELSSEANPADPAGLPIAVSYTHKRNNQVLVSRTCDLPPVFQDQGDEDLEEGQDAGDKPSFDSDDDEPMDFNGYGEAF